MLEPEEDLVDREPPIRKSPAALPALTPAERLELQARRAFRRLAAGQGKRSVWWQLRSRP